MITLMLSGAAPVINTMLINERGSFMDCSDWKAVWKKEEEAAHIHGWDFSHIRGRFEEENDLPWDYEALVRQYLKGGMDVLDYDTGGGEFLLSLNHPYDKTAATEGYPPNVELCAERLLPLGIDFKECGDPAQIPFPNEAFDLVLNRHGSFDAAEIFRLLRRGGVLITQQVGGDNDRDLVERVLPGTKRPFPHLYLARQRKNFEDAGFQIIRAEEAYRPIEFYDVGAFVWFARIIEWEFPGFSVDRCFERLLKMQEALERDGKIVGTIHRYLIIAQK